MEKKCCLVFRGKWPEHLLDFLRIMEAINRKAVIFEDYANVRIKSLTS